MNKYVVAVIFLVFFRLVHAQQIADFISVTPTSQGTNFNYPFTHDFQKIIEHGDAIIGGTMNHQLDIQLDMVPN